MSTASVSLRAVLATGAAVLVLWVVSFGLSYVSLGAAAMPVAMVIAVLKAGLVALFFMEIVVESWSIKLTMAAAITMALLLGGFMLADIATRDVQPFESPAGETPAR